MRFYTKISFWENSRRIARLRQFRELVDFYFRVAAATPADAEAASRRGPGGSDTPSAPAALLRYARRKVDAVIGDATTMIVLSGVEPTVTWTPPQAREVPVRQFHLLANIHNLDRFGIPETAVPEVIDRAIAVYRASASGAFWRTVNPLFILDRILDMFVGKTFVLLGRAGYPIEESFAGKMARELMYLGGAVAILALVVLALAGTAGYTITLQPASLPGPLF